MTNIVRLADHARASAGRRGFCTSASRSIVSGLPLSSAKRTKAGHQSAGMRPLDCQLQTTDRPAPTPTATAAVPPSSLMMVSTDIPALYFTDREGVKLHALGSDLIHVSWILAPMGTSVNAVGRRLIALTKAQGISQADLCRAIGIKENRFSQYLSGDRRLSVEVAIKIKNHYGVTTDWLFTGDPSALPAHLHAKLAKPAAA